MAARHALGRLVSAALTLTLVLGAVPAFAAGSGTPAPDATVTAHVHVAGADVDLFGLNAADARTAIAAACTTPTLAPLAVDATGTMFTLAVSNAVACDVSGMVDAAFSATEETTLTPAWAPRAAAIKTFAAAIAKKIDRKKADAKRTIVKRRLKVVKQIDGRSVDTTGAVSAVTAAVTAELAADGSVQPTVTVSVKLLPAKVRVSNIGKTILVVLRERRVYLYNGAKLEKTYRCAVGQKRYPTPVGTWKIVKKVKNPSWHNNGSAWARHMPAYIAPGLNNPLGTRALYLNASGIRIHGIPRRENSSIGHAASHGCIRLKNSNAVDLYPRVKVGTPVYIVR